LVAVVSFQFTSWSQEEPDYAAITFKNKLFKYKKKKPNLKGLKVKKENIKEIVTLLGTSFYSEDQIQQITDNVWLSFIDPKKFDFVFRDIGVRTNPKWNKKNARGKIVLEPNAFLKVWTEANGEPPYMQKALSRVLSYYKLMATAEDAKAAKTALNTMLYSKKYRIRAATKSDWTNSYLQYANNGLQQDGLVAIIANNEYDFAICKIAQKEKLIELFQIMDWIFITP